MRNHFIIYTPGTPCIKCDATKRVLNKYGIAFVELLAENHPDVIEEAKAEGHAAFPIVIAPDGSWWTDFRKDRLDVWGRAQGVWRNGAA